MANAITLDRRAFLAGCVAAGGGLLLSVPAVSEAQPVSPAPARMGAFLAVHTDSSVRITVPVVEMGQGAQSSLAAIIADELGADWERVTVVPPPAAPEYQRPDVTKYQLTSGSWSVRLWYGPMRQAGAAAREMLKAAAAARWQVAAEECDTRHGRVVHLPSQRSIPFGELAQAAAALPVPASPALRAKGDLKLIGRRVPRTDIPSKVDGSGVFGVDVRLPGMVHAALRQAPVYGAEVESVDSARVRRLPGVLDVVVVPGAVVVVADSWWRARKAVQAANIRFKPTPHDRVTTGQLLQEETARLGQEKGAQFRAQGDFAAAAATASRVLTADYAVPFIHHAPMEPMNCTASVTGGRCELWVPTQCHTTALEAAMRLTGLPESRITIHATLLGGAFGRRIHTDFIEQAIHAAKAVRRPVKLIWTREEDIQHGFHRPAMMARMTATLDPQAQVTGLKMRIVGPSVHEKFWPAFFKDGLDYAAVMAITTKNAASGLHYAIPNQFIDYVYQPTHVPIGYWRAVGASHNGFFMEGLVDELAHAAGQDPARFRRHLLRDSTRALAVLDKAIEASGWGAPLPAGRGRGIAFCDSVDSIVAQVAEVSVQGDKLKIHRIVAIIDCGMAINPDTIEAQMQGGILNALSAALAEEITIQDGRCTQGNFHDYPILRMAGAPPVEVHIIESGGPIGGVGEAMVPTLAPAVCNAIFAASGRRLRSLPLKAHGLTLV